MSYTINLSRARTFSRQRRAQKAMRILREELEDRENTTVSISPEVNSKIWERGAEKPPSKLEVEVVMAGGEKTAVLPDKKPDQTTQETTEEPGESKEDYSQVVSGTVSEAKEKIEELESPDYNKLLEAEEEGKNRKTLKEFIQERN